MKKVLIFFFSALISLSTYAEVEVYLLYASYNSPDQPYVEAYMSMIGESRFFNNTV
jgi:hypothetical protein